MSYRSTFLTLFAALCIGFAGCDTTDTEPVVTEPATTEADVQVAPGDELTVDVVPE